MSDRPTSGTPMSSQDGLDLLIRFGLIVVLVVLCDRVLGPFWHILLWALILAVGLSPLQQTIADKMSGNQGWSAALLIATLLLVLGIPIAILTASFGEGIIELRNSIENRTLDIPAPSESVAQWPLIGEKIYSTWHLAAFDTPAFVQSLQPNLGQLARKLLAAAQSAVAAGFLFIGALIIAGIMMAYSRPGHDTAQRIFTRLAGEHGPTLLTLCIATVRSVAVGVLGVALIQSILLGLGFVIADVPMAGLLAVIALLLGILQIPAALVVIPVLVWLWTSSDASVTANAFYTAFLLLAGLSDNVLKPLLLGRGVDIPMPVILLGALGGMFTAGFIGLFMGAVGLAVGYKVFMAWVDRDLDKAPAPPSGHQP